MKIKNFIPSFNAAMAQDEVKTLNKFFARKLIFIFHQGVSFDSNNKPNMQQKTVTISANTQSGRETLRIKAMVNADPVKQKQRDELAKARQQQNPN